MLIYLLSLVADEQDKLIFSSMFEQYETKTYYVAMSILHNQHDAEDAMMAAWMNVISHFDTAKRRMMESASTFEAWITTITKNAAKDELRKRKRAPEPIEMWDMPAPGSTEEKVEEMDTIKKLKSMIKSMPSQTRSILEMRLIGEYSFKEIGMSVGCSAGTAEKRFARAKAELVRRMGAETI